MPFLGSFGILMFLLLMQFLIRYLPELVGRGLPLTVLGELISYSLAYMVVLAVPMATLIGTVATFGSLAESRAYLVSKSAGISLVQIGWPALALGFVLVGGMAYFNNVMLPEANYRMKGLWIDIRTKKPGFELEPGVFYDGIEGYTILAQRIPPESNELYGVTILETSPGSERTTLIAERGELASEPGGILTMTLHEGEAHRFKRVVEAGASVERYERLAFSTNRIRFDLSNLDFQRSGRDASRSDRSTPTSEMLVRVDTLNSEVATTIGDLRENLMSPPKTPPKLGERLQLRPRYDIALRQVRQQRRDIEAAAMTAQWKRDRINRYWVEIYKKFSLATACVIFVLVGIPLGLAVPRYGVGPVGAAGVFIFLFYWVTLNQGEKLADRGFLPAWVGMWVANVLIGLVGVYLFRREQREPVGRDWLGALLSLLPKTRG